MISPKCRSMVEAPQLSNINAKSNSVFGYFVKMISGTFLVLAILVFPVRIEAQDIVGYVLSIEGNWNLKGGKQPIQRWQRLAAGARIVARKPVSKSNYVTIALFGGETVHRKCDDIQKCYSGIALPKSSSSAPSRGRQTAETASRGSIVELISDVFKALFEHHESYLVPTLARSRASPRLREAVVLWNSSQVDLSPLFKDMGPGSYRLSAVLRGKSSEPVNPSDLIPIVINWDPEQATAATTDKLNPGLYRLIGESTDEVWVLVAPAAKYAAANNSFLKAIEKTKQWGSTVDTATAQMFLRAYLERLSTVE